MPYKRIYELKIMCRLAVELIQFLLRIECVLSAWSSLDCVEISEAYKKKKADRNIYWYTQPPYTYTSMCVHVCVWITIYLIEDFSFVQSPVHMCHDTASIEKIFNIINLLTERECLIWIRSRRLNRIQISLLCESWVLYYIYSWLGRTHKQC